MKIFGEELGGVGRWYIALPPILLLGFLIGLFYLATAGQSRLEAVNERVHKSQQREQALSEYVALITSAETAQRGYMLTEQDTFMQQYLQAVSGIDPALRAVRDAYGSAGDNGVAGDTLRKLTDAKLAELAQTLNRFETKGSGSLIADIDTGKRDMDLIQRQVAKMRRDETAELSLATARWRGDLQWTRWFTTACICLNIGLVLLAISLVYGDMRRRARLATDLRDQKQELERLVEERTRELMDLSTHLQEVSEEEKSALSRELHDELGGLLIAARMDLSWLQQRLPTNDPAIEQRFKRIHESLSAGVDLKRRVVEELRPTLLDNMGLFAALRWQFKETCRRRGLRCTESIPDAEPGFDPDAAIGIFRVAQEAMTNILKHADATAAHLSVEMAGGLVVLRVGDDGKGIGPGRLKAQGSHGLASMRHRVSALGGSWDISGAPGGGTMVTAAFPLSRVVLARSA